jgi:5-methylcytosine-specific restriction endonuclease McrA
MSFWSKRGKAFEREWKERTRHVTKPCWELRYCPYGSLVDDFPVPIERSNVKDIINSLRSQLAKGSYKGKEKTRVEQLLKDLNPRDYPEEMPKEVKYATCSIFGHICPVFFVNEPLSENPNLRNITRYVPRDVLMRVARRDNYTCQKCGTHLKDDEIELHHRIPFARGGPTEENNLEVRCFDCNRADGSELPEGFIVPDFWSSGWVDTSLRTHR